MQNPIRRIVLAGAAAMAVMLAPGITQAQDFDDVESNGKLHLRGYGSFFIEGDIHEVTPPVGSNFGGGSGPGLSMINQMYVQFMHPQKQKGKKHVPIGIIHGCCLSTKSWQTTPDGRMGWDEYFVRQNFDTYMMDQVGRARSGFDATSYNKVRYGLTPCEAPFPCDEQPNILIATDQFAWNIFRWGETSCTVSPCSDTTDPHPDLKFPIETIGVGADSNNQFYAMVIPDLSGTLSGAPSPSDPAGFYNSPSQMAKLASQVGGMTLMGHSQSASFPTRAALQPGSGCYPWTTEDACNVKGIIQIETGCFANLTDDEIETLSHIPILIVRGDYYTEAVPQSCYDMQDDINTAGGDMKIASMPNLVPDDLYPGSPGPMPGIEHMMMIGTQNIEVADLLIGWLSYRGL